MNTKTVVVGLIVVIVLLFGWYYYNDATTPGQYDEFAQCLADKDATFYGAFWCPNCQNQKELFGKSERLLKYTECSTPNGQNQLKVCSDASIEAYPTWEFSDSSRLVGVLSFEKLAENIIHTFKFYSEYYGYQKVRLQYDIIQLRLLRHSNPTYVILAFRIMHTWCSTCQ